MYLGIDVGGTKTLLASLDASGNIVDRVKFPTPQTYPELITAIQAAARQLSQEPYQLAAAGVPGILDRKQGLVLSYGHRDWTNNPIKTDLSAALGCPILIENDGKLGGLAAAIDIINEYKNVLYLAIGTGIGICYTANGIIDQSIDDGGGHTLLLEHDGQTLPWEDFAGGLAIIQKYGLQASEITDPVAWQAIAHNFTQGIEVLLTDRTPDAIVVGGGVGAHLDKFAHFLEEDLTISLGSCPPLLQANDAEEIVIHGCYQLIKQYEATA